MKPQNYLQQIAGVGLYPVITLLIFFIFFTMLAIWVIRARKQHYTSISGLPLDGGELPAEQPLS